MPQKVKPALVGKVGDVEVYLDVVGFFNRCTASKCPYISKYTASKSTATQWATAHSEGQPDDGRET